MDTPPLSPEFMPHRRSRILNSDGRLDASDAVDLSGRTLTMDTDDGLLGLRECEVALIDAVDLLKAQWIFCSCVLCAMEWRDGKWVVYET